MPGELIGGAAVAVFSFALAAGWDALRARRDRKARQTSALAAFREEVAANRDALGPLMTMVGHEDRQRRARAIKALVNPLAQATRRSPSLPCTQFRLPDDIGCEATVPAHFPPRSSPTARSLRSRESYEQDDRVVAINSERTDHEEPRRSPRWLGLSIAQSGS
jgi:hypothetical protein